jgi:5'-3' exonuclease
VSAAATILEGKTHDECLQEAQSAITKRLLDEIDNLNRSQFKEFLLAFADHMKEMSKYASSREHKGNPRDVIKKISDRLYDAAREASGLKTGEKYGYTESVEDKGETLQEYYTAKFPLAKKAMEAVRNLDEDEMEDFLFALDGYFDGGESSGYKESSNISALIYKAAQIWKNRNERYA